MDEKRKEELADVPMGRPVCLRWMAESKKMFSRFAAAGERYAVLMVAGVVTGEAGVGPDGQPGLTTEIDVETNISARDLETVFAEVRRQVRKAELGETIVRPLRGLPDDAPVNEFLVGGTGGGNQVVILTAPQLGRLTQPQAIRLAAWLAVMADDPDLVKTFEMAKRIQAT